MTKTTTTRATSRAARQQPQPLPAKRPRGRPAVLRDERTATQVKTLIGMGMPSQSIALVIGMARHTMQKLYMHELETGHLMANAQVAQSLYNMATDKKKPNVAAAIFWLKTRARWRENDDGGKKQADELLSRVADKGTQWEGLLATGDAEEPEEQQ